RKVDYFWNTKGMSDARKYAKRPTSLILNFLFFCVLFQFGCKENGKGKYMYTSQVGKNLYIEVYKTFASGAYGGDILTNYLTDSANFRVFVGSFDDYDSHFSYKCLDDSLMVYNMYKSETDTVFRIRQINSYKLSNLKKLQNISKAIIDS